MGDAAAMPVRAFLKHFHEEFEHHITHKSRIIPRLSHPRSPADHR
ncbi:hypothetical protein [Mycobacterium tuberculosis]